MPETSGTFDVSFSPADGDDARWGRRDITKTWHGGVEGAGAGVMLAAGDPAAGSAGYVAIESVDGAVDGRRGTFALQQMGTMHAGGSRIEYVVVPGSGTGELAGVGGVMRLTVEADGTHRYELSYTLG